MSSMKTGHISGEVAGAATAAEDRRRHDRLNLMKSMQVSNLDSGLVLETATAVDISREGIYFTVRSRHYRVGMELRLTIPSLKFEGVCKVVRMEELPTGCLGIAGSILGW